MAKTVMIVDDSASIRQVVSLTLKGAGYDVMEAGDGKEAFAENFQTLQDFVPRMAKLLL